MERGAPPKWKRKEMGLAEALCPGGAQLAEMGRSQLGREQERMRDRRGAQTRGW